MLFKRHAGLGLIPDWQFSMDPAVNPKINPHVVYPAGMTQQTIQPVGAVWGAQGLGMSNPFDSWGWQNRKLIAGGAVAVVGVGLIAALAAIFK